MAVYEFCFICIFFCLYRVSQHHRWLQATFILRIFDFRRDIFDENCASVLHILFFVEMEI